MFVHYLRTSKAFVNSNDSYSISIQSTHNRRIPQNISGTALYSLLKLVATPCRKMKNRKFNSNHVQTSAAARLLLHTTLDWVVVFVFVPNFVSLYVHRRVYRSNANEIKTYSSHHHSLNVERSLVSPFPFPTASTFNVFLFKWNYTTYTLTHILPKAE